MSRKRYRSIKNRVEIKYNAPNLRIDHFIPGTSATTWYHWRSFCPDTQYVPGLTDAATGETEAIAVPVQGAYSSLTSFNGLNLCTRIQEGTAAFERVGSSINILKDKYTFEWRVRRDNGEYWKAPPTTPTAVATGCSNRPFRVRLVGIYMDRIQEPGASYLGVNEVFEEYRSIHSNFRAEYKHFTVVYDKTFMLTTAPPDVEVGTGFTGDGPAIDNSLPTVVQCKFSSKPYVKTWDQNNTIGYDTSGFSTGTAFPLKMTRLGCTRGMIQWFYYLEDMAPPILEHSGTGDLSYQHPSLGFHVVMKRVIKYTDP